MIGYSIIRIGKSKKPLIITIEIPKNAITNINRKNIVDIKHAYHFTNKAKVLKIGGILNEQTYESITYECYFRNKLIDFISIDGRYISFYDLDKSKYNKYTHRFLTKYLITLKVGEFVKYECIQTNEQYDCDEGVYFDTKIDDYIFAFDKYYDNCNGTYFNYYENGQIESEENYKNNKLDGPYKVYDEDGTKILECNYKNNKLHGLYRSYNPNNVIDYECIYVDDVELSI